MSMTDIIYVIIVIIGGLFCYSIPEVYKRYCDYKEKELKENLQFQLEIESLKHDSFKEDVQLKIEEERTKQLQIKSEFN